MPGGHRQGKALFNRPLSFCCIYSSLLYITVHLLYIQYMLYIQQTYSRGIQHLLCITVRLMYIQYLLYIQQIYGRDIHQLLYITVRLLYIQYLLYVQQTYNRKRQQLLYIQYLLYVQYIVQVGVSPEQPFLNKLAKIDFFAYYDSFGSIFAQNSRVTNFPTPGTLIFATFSKWPPFYEVCTLSVCMD